MSRFEYFLNALSDESAGFIVGIWSWQASRIDYDTRGVGRDMNIKEPVEKYT